MQLHGSEPNQPLQEFLESAGATVLTVAPYVYAGAEDDDAVRSLLARRAAGEVDAIAFTRSPQVEWLFALAPADIVKGALAHTVVAAVGPVVTQALARRGVEVRVVPKESFFIKPLTLEI